MRKYTLLFLLLFCISCTSIDVINDKDLINNSIKSSQQADSQVTFSYDSITHPDNWKKYNSLEEMQSACQIPSNILKKISTEHLVDLCMNYPLYGIRNLKQL